MADQSNSCVAVFKSHVEADGTAEEVPQAKELLGSTQAEEIDEHAAA